MLGDFSVRVKRNSLRLPPAAVAAAAAAAAAAPGAAGSAARKQQQQQEPAPASSSPESSAGGVLADLELMHRVSAYPPFKSWGKADLAPKVRRAWCEQPHAARWHPPHPPRPAHRSARLCAPPQGHGVSSPPAWFLQHLAQRLRHQLGLNLFNFDLIVPWPTPHGERANSAAANGAGAGGDPPQQQQDIVQQQQQQGQEGEATRHRRVVQYHLIDINYFPGYEKLPEYEQCMMRFLRSIAAQRQPQPQQQQSQQQQPVAAGSGGARR